MTALGKTCTSNNLGDLAHQYVGNFRYGVTAIHTITKGICAKDNGISRASVHWILKTAKWKRYVLRL